MAPVVHLIRAATLTGFEALLASLGGGEPGPLLAAAGLPADTLSPDAEDQYLPQNRFERLLELAASRTGCPHFALLLGARQALSMLGVIGFVMQQSPDVRTALGELQRHFYLQAQGSAIEVDAGDEVVELGFVVHDAASLSGIRYGSELCLAAGMPVMRTLCGSTFRPDFVQFAHPAPRNRRPYREVFDAPVRFAQERNAVVFAARWLDVKIDAADPHLNRILHTYLELLADRYADDPVAQVRHLIRRALASGACSAANVASFMGMHRRTLHRVLRRHDTTFSTLLEEVRRDIAVRTLAHSRVPVTHLADMLCYSDTSAFTRAFRRWAGCSPQRWRLDRQRHGA